jgi:hypothetical protein
MLFQRGAASLIVLPLQCGQQLDRHVHIYSSMRWNLTVSTLEGGAAERERFASGGIQWKDPVLLDAL